MKYLLLPLSLIEFWYPEGLIFFLRTWKNLMLFLEEDLAVILMWRLLLVPLFHDSSWVGRVLSFIFRLSRILFGLFAFFTASMILLMIALYWFTLPLLVLVDFPKLISQLLFLGGLGLFVLHITLHPHKKVWAAKNIWEASFLKKKDINFSALLKKREILDLLQALELQASYLPQFTITDINQVSEKAFYLAKNSNSYYVGPQPFFVAALEDIPNIDNLLLQFDLKLSDFVEALNFLEKKKQVWRKVYVWDEEFSVRHLKGVNRGWLGVPTPSLDAASLDLTKEASTTGFQLFLRSTPVIVELVNILSQESSRNVIVVGPPGSGKSALIKHLAGMIVVGDAPPALAIKRLVLLDLTKLLSGITTQGELADRIKAIFEEVRFSQNIIIVIEEIHQFGIGEAGVSFNLYALMQPYLESGEFQFIGTTEAENYNKVLEKNASFARLFRKIELPIATSQDTLNILEDLAIETERKNKIKTSFIALKTATSLAEEFIRDRVLPDSAISILKEAQAQPVGGRVTKEVVKQVISSRVKIPAIETGSADKERLLNLESELHSKLVAQHQAVKGVADVLRRAATGLVEKNRPLGSFLFVGPTGVGKTELAKNLAESYFKNSDAFIRLDMSEYQNPESIVRLIGGVGEGGILTESVRNRPYSLLLLDEFEKAHEKILTLFLQVLDDGRLTDGAGRTVHFENTIIIATSNAGSLLIAQGLKVGKRLEEIDREVNAELLKIFKPELINRFDEVVIFTPLTQEELQQIVAIKLNELKAAMKEKGYLLEFDEQVLEELSRRGYDPILGARPLRRLIQDTIEANLSKLILENKLTKGNPFRVGVELLG